MRIRLNSRLPLMISALPRAAADVDLHERKLWDEGCSHKSIALWLCNGSSNFTPAKGYAHSFFLVFFCCLFVCLFNCLGCCCFNFCFHFHNFIIPFLENVGCLFCERRAATRVAHIHPGRCREWGFCEFCQGSGELPLLFIDFQLPRDR